MNCIICNNNDNNQIFTVKELNLGLNEEFHYMLCNNCNSTQLIDPPKDFSHYYPTENYYSFKLEKKNLKGPKYFRSSQASYILYGKNKFAGWLFSLGYKIPEFYEWMINTKAEFTDTILDVGCGNGSLLTKLYKMGFKNLIGIDPFINEDHDYGDIKIYKKEILDLRQNFDVI